MAFESPFWRQCKPSLTTEPYIAGTTESKPVRKKEDLDWLYGKIAYASATAGGASLDTAGWSEKFYDGTGAWNKIKKGGTSEDDTWNDPVYIPKAHITSVTITGDPASYGAVRTCKVAFKTYNKGQLNALKDFFRPGVPMNATLGWHGRLGSSARSETFTGTLYKFNISLSPDGGYECTSEGIGKGATPITNIKVDAAITLSGVPEITDEQGTKIPNGNIFGAFKIMAEQAKNLTKGKATLGGKDGAVAEIPEDYEQGKEKGSGTNQSKQLKGYITVESIRQILNEVIKKYCKSPSGGVPAGFEWPDPAMYMQAPTFPEIISSDPINVLIENNKYGDLEFSPGLNKSIVGSNLEPKNVYISLDWLIKKSEINYIDTDRNKISYLKLGDFWKNIFSLIQQSLGDTFNLTLARNAGDENDERMYIIDINAIDKAVTPKAIDSEGVGNWARNINLTSNLTSEVATAFYVTTQASVTAKAGSGDELLKFLGLTPAKTDTAVSSKAFEDAKIAVGKNPHNAAFVSSLAACNKEQTLNARTSSPMASVLVPFELTATLEGTTGFKYGDAICSNYVPDIYNFNAKGGSGLKVGFMVTQVEHLAQDGDWTTTLSTQCRLYK